MENIFICTRIGYSPVVLCITVLLQELPFSCKGLRKIRNPIWVKRVVIVPHVCRCGGDVDSW